MLDQRIQLMLGQQAIMIASLQLQLEEAQAALAKSKEEKKEVDA